MNAPDQVIVLAAGKSSQLDGISKVLIRHPRNCRTILDHVIEAFAGCKITVVVGFRAIHIMQHYPELHYVHNPDWALTNNAGSLGLALAELGPKPCYVISGDIFLERALIERLNTAAPNMVLTSTREKRAQSAVHCVTDEDGRVLETYQGPVRSMAHPESVGLFKIGSAPLLRAWQRRCIEHANLFAGQLLPCGEDDAEITSVALRDNELFFEVNAPTDYLELIDTTRLRAAQPMPQAWAA
ncbi:MAG TPA: NTP transferase domain-containing protein [Rubrivivax sp.]|nr:NTP transferase domain-containing protein [Burkholderiales bacterium]HNT39649.1 NTP transferase domain-containing protein [Rubrivivax sp.]